MPCDFKLPVENAIKCVLDKFMKLARETCGKITKIGQA